MVSDEASRWVRVACPSCLFDTEVSPDDRECNKCGERIPDERIEATEAQWGA